MMIIDSFTFLMMKCSHSLVLNQYFLSHRSDFEIISKYRGFIDYPYVAEHSVTHI